MHLLAYEEDKSPFCDITIADEHTHEVVSTVQRIEFRRFEADVEVGPHVWQTEWVEIESPKQSVDGRRCFVVPDDTGIAQTVEKCLRSADVDTVIASVDDEFSELKSQSFTDVLVIQPLSLNHWSSLNQVTLQTFRTIQEKFSQFCLSLISDVTALNPGIWPRLIFVTRGAHVVISGEDVHPFMSYVPSILMTYMHEEPKLQTVSLDIPLSVSASEASSIIHEAFLHLPSDENILAVRKCKSHQLYLTYSLFAPRLRVQSVANVRLETSNKSWVIEEQDGRAKVYLKKSTTPTLSINHNSYDHLDLQAFYITKSEDIFIEDSSNPGQVNIFTLQAGVSRKPGKHMAKPVECPSQSKRRKKEIQSVETVKVLGVTDGVPILSASCHLDKDRTELVEIPDTIGCSEAIYIVKEYLPSQIFFHDVFSVNTSTAIIFLATDEISQQILSFPLLACSMGAQTTVVDFGNNSTANSKIKDLKECFSCNIISIADAQDLKPSADLLIVPMTDADLHKQVPKFLRKLNNSGTVLYLYDDIIKPVTLTPGVASVKNMAYTTSLPRVLGRQTREELAEATKAILTRIKDQPCLEKMLETPNQRTLSETPLINMTVPHSTIINVTGEHSELPFELHDDLWFADEKASYLVTGGTSGFGLCVVKWLVARGAGHVFILSRHAPGSKAMEYIKHVNKGNKPRITCYEADITNADQIEQVLTTIQSSDFPPLTGIFHLAVQYRDGYFQTMTYDRWNIVLETKAFGALILHQLTQRLQIPLKHFVVSSSLDSLLGNAGQGNYCAANNFLNSLCQKRHHLGLPATAICIGFINTVGYAASNNHVKLGEERGMLSIAPMEVLNAFSVALATGTPLIGVGGALISRRFAQKHRDFIKQHFSGNRENFSLYKGIFLDAMDMTNLSSGVSFKQMIQEKSEEEAKTFIMDELQKILTTQLGISNTINDDEPLLSLGVDSLMSTRLSDAIIDKFQVTINPVQLISDQTTAKLLQHMIFKQMTEITSENIDDRWIVDGEYTDSNMILVCFPPSGSGASFYAQWVSHVAQLGIQLLRVQLPGWEGREREKTVDSMQEIVHHVTEALVNRLHDQKFVFFGHSIGSLMAFETAHHLKSVHNLHPKHIFISSWYAPTLSYPHPEELKYINARTFGSLQKVLQEGQTFLEFVRKEHDIKLSFIDDTYLNDNNMLLRLLPAMESVFNILQVYKCERRDPLQCGMTVLGGKDDQFVNPSLFDEWKHQVAPNHSFEKETFHGKHMYILTCTKEILEKIVMVLTTK